MTENLPDSFDPRQPDLPTKAVDPDPIPEDHEARDTYKSADRDSGGAYLEPLDDHSDPDDESTH